jgi:hypothetical protein
LANSFTVSEFRLPKVFDDGGGSRCSLSQNSAVAMSPARWALTASRLSASQALSWRSVFVGLELDYRRLELWDTSFQFLLHLLEHPNSDLVGHFVESPVCGGDDLTLPFEGGLKVVQPMLVLRDHRVADLLKFRLEPLASPVDLGVMVRVPVALDLTNENVPQRAGVQRFEGVQLGRTFAELFLEPSASTFALLDRSARQAVGEALLVRQHDRPDLHA